MKRSVTSLEKGSNPDLGESRLEVVRPGWVGALTTGVLLGLGIALVDWRLFSSRRRGPRAGEGALGPGRTDNADEGSWKQIALRTWREFTADRIPSVAAGATFYCLLAVFPAIGAFVSLYGLFSSVEDARREVQAMRAVLPAGTISVLSDQMTRLAASPHAGLGASLVLSLMVSIWSSNAGMKALLSGLNVAYEEPERRGLFRLNLISLAFTLGAMLFSIVAVAAIAAVPRTLARLDLVASPAADLLRWPGLFLVVVGVFALLYRCGPSRARAGRRRVAPGSVLAAVGWMAMSVGYSNYLASFGHLDRTYGPLGAAVGFMTWIWLSLIVVLLGAELNAELERQSPTDGS